jgi:prophage DNA circulation protein
MTAPTNPPLWLQNYRPASFRGAIFFVANVDSAFGRRIITHEYPQRDIPYSEDLGRKYRRFTVSGYLVGGSYNLQRDQLVRACEQAGPGELVHPYQGSLQVVCEGVVVRERREDGGYCEVALTFAEDGENVFPSAISNPATAVDLSSDACQSSASKFFEKVYNLANLPEFVRTEMRDAANKLLDPVDRLLSASSEFADGLAAFKRDLGTLIYQPRALAAGFLDVINDITKLVGKNKSTSATLHEMALSALRLVPETTSTRTRQSRSQDALQEMVKQMAVAEHARVVAGQDYISYQEALTARQQLADEIDTVSETAADEVYDTLQLLRAKVVQALPDPKLPEIQTLTMRQATPAIVLAYKLYGDALRDSDITARNSIRHPGFIPGGSSVEVVISG